MKSCDNYRVRTIAVTQYGSMDEPVIILQVSTPPDVDDDTFLAQFRKAKAARRNSYDASVKAVLEAMRRKYGYGLDRIVPDINIDASRSEWAI